MSAPFRIDEPLDESGARLALLVPVAPAPSPRVKDRLFARIRAAGASAQRTKEWRFTALAANEHWIPLPLPGVRMRELTIDAERDTALLYVEMAPGAAFPDHDHSAPERGLVLSGDFRMGEHVLRAGDFYEAGAGTRHQHLTSPSGCTGLLWVSANAWQRWRAVMAPALRGR